MTARSESGSSPTSSAAATRPSGSVTSRELPPPATWLLVTMYPSGVMMNPEPEPDCLPRPRVARSTRMWATAGATWATTLVTAVEYASSISASVARGSWRSGIAARASSPKARGTAESGWEKGAIPRKMETRLIAFKAYPSDDPWPALRAHWSSIQDSAKEARDCRVYHPRHDCVGQVDVRTGDGRWLRPAGRRRAR